MISIAMATYNGEKYLKEQIDSLLAVEKVPGQEIEIVICDDCSIDSTYSILQEYQRQNSFMHIYKNEKNIGYVKNFEKAISLCSGEYIALCDQDDIWLSNHLVTLYNGIKGHELCGADAILVDINNNELGSTLFQSFAIEELPTEINDYRFFILYRNIFQGAASMITRRLAYASIPFPEGIHFHDYWLVYIAFLLNLKDMKKNNTENILPVNYINQPCLRYRQHGDNVTENDTFNIISRIIKNIKSVFRIKRKTKINKILDNRIYDMECLKTVLEKQGEYTKLYLSDLNQMIKYYKAYRSGCPCRGLPFFCHENYRLNRNSSKKLFLLRLIKRVLGIK